MSQENNGDILKVEDSLKLLMQNMFRYMEQFKLSESEIQLIEKNYINEYENLGQFSEIVVKFFDYFTKKIDDQLKKKRMKERKNDTGSESDTSFITESEEYRRLEEILQKHEAEIRNYLRIQLQTKLMMESNKQKQEDQEKEKQEIIYSTKQHLLQKNKEILSLHNEIAGLKKQVDDLQEINDNQEFSIKEYEKEIKDLSQYKQKCKHLQKLLDDQSKTSSNTLAKKEGSFKAMNISLNLKKSLNNEIKHCSDPDLNKHALNSNNSSRNKNQLNASSISTLCTNTNQKLATPNKNERVRNPTNSFLQNNLLSVSSRGGNSIVNNIYQSQYSSSNGGYLGGVSSTNTQSLNSHPMHEIQDQVNHQASSAQKIFQDNSIKQQLIKQIKDVNKESLNKSSQKEQKVNSNNTSQHMESKDLAAYLSSGPIQSIQNSNNNSFIGMNTALKQHKRSKSQQGSKMKGTPFVSNHNINSAGRASSSLNHRNRNLNSSTYHHNTSAADYSSLVNILNKDSYLDMNLQSINANVINPNNNSINNMNNKVNVSSSSNNNNTMNNNSNSNIYNNSSNTTFSQQQMMIQLYNQSNNNALSASRNTYHSTGKRAQSRTAQHK